MAIVATLLMVVGSCCLYLSSPKQLWCQRHWPLFARLAGILLLAVSFILYWGPYQPVVAIAIWFTGAMCAFVVLPYSGAALQIRRGQRHG